MSNAASPASPSGISPLLTAFPQSPAQPMKPGQWQTECTTDYTPSGSRWQTGLDEHDVFQALIRHEQGPENSYELRMGKGGQIYSLIGPFGEAVPPQWRPSESRGGATGAPWVDEVFQCVSVASSQTFRLLEEQRKIRIEYFIHQAGVYLNEPTQTRPFYSPLLAQGWDPPRAATR